MSASLSLKIPAQCFKIRPFTRTRYTGMGYDTVSEPESTRHAASSDTPDQVTAQIHVPFTGGAILRRNRLSNSLKRLPFQSGVGASPQWANQPREF